MQFLPNICESFSQFIDIIKTLLATVYPFIHPFTYKLEKEINHFLLKKDISHFQAILIYTIIISLTILALRFFNKIWDSLFGYQRKSIVAHIFSFSIKNIWFVRNIFKSQITKISEHFKKDLDKKCSNQKFELSQQGVSEQDIRNTLGGWYKREEDLTYTGKVSGCRYTEDSKLDELIRSEAKNFMYHNPLHTTDFPSTRQMECELIHMTCNLFSNPDGYGIIAAGGTESIALAMLAHRNYYREYRGITKPNVVMPNSAHLAFIKACHNFDIETRVINVNPQTLTLTASQLSKHIDSNTICIVGSVPNFPYGNVDNIPEYAQLAKKRGVGLHVDCCLGGFLVAFQDHVEGMKDIPDFDFRVDGVTSISCDHHQYGLAPKGVSIVMFKSNELRHGAYFGVGSWPGGLYCTPTLLGSRSSAPIAGAWIAMNYQGKQGYIKNAIQIDAAIQEIRKGIQADFKDHYQIMGSQASCVAFKSLNRNINIYVLNDLLHKKFGWSLAALQRPAAIHISVTLKIANNTKQLLKDLKDCTDELLKNPQQQKGTTVELYGAAVQIPDTAALETAMRYIVDGFLGMGQDDVSQ